jgi:Alw26I/Eco31I/Esp3I family type II restriction endonuclease
MEDNNDFSHVSEDPADYGSKGENWAGSFVNYMKFIVSHPVYENMPDAIKADGKVQWEAPSNRSGGLYQHTHQKRRNWWQSKAKSIGIDINSDKWISRTAKLIHPTGKKPCKRCGTVLDIAYVYPQKNLIKRIQKKFGDDIEISSIDHINDVILNLIEVYGNESIKDIEKLLSTNKISVPSFNSDIDNLLKWVNDVYIPSEPSLLSPGAMSNAPDRFDGFHSFNRCCRGTADKGRSKENLMSYVTDRRVFEYWSEGDWIAADRLMGLVRTNLSSEKNADGGEGPPTADHIGPLSLGFCHRPRFRLLSKSANSAKNNRMSFGDVSDLIKDEAQGYKVISWYGESLWNILKLKVNSEENALRLSKMLRDNQRNAMVLLSKLYNSGVYVLLIYLLELDYADNQCEFKNLKVDNFLTNYDSIIKTPRENKYTLEQKSRRLRIGFDSLRLFLEKENRHLFVIKEDDMEASVNKIIKLFDYEKSNVKALDLIIEKHLNEFSGKLNTSTAKQIIQIYNSLDTAILEKAKKILDENMNEISLLIAKLWNDDRYVRETENS